MKLLFLLLVAILTSHALITDTNPGLKLKLSKAAIDYASEVAVDMLYSDIRSRPIPDFLGYSGKLQYEISNIHINRLMTHGSSIETDSDDGITLTITYISASVQGNWSYQWGKELIPIRDNGTFDFVISHILLRLKVDMGVDTSGKPTLWIKSRDTLLGSVNLIFLGGESWFYSMFYDDAEREITSKLRSVMNGAIDELINEKARRTLEGIKVRVPVNDLITLDYRLVAAPEIASDYILFSHRGAFVWTEDDTGNLLLPPSIADLSGTPRMITLCLSDYISNSLGYVLYNYGNFLLRYNLTESDLPPNIRDCLNLARYPEIAEGQSTGTIHLLMYATEPPTLHTDENDIRGYIRGTVEVKLTKPSGQLVTLLSLDATANVAIAVRVNEKRITGQIKYLGLTTNIRSPAVDEQTTADITLLIGLVSEYFLVPKLSEVGRLGYPIPNIDGVKYINPLLFLMKDAVCILTDVRYEP